MFPRKLTHIIKTNLDSEPHLVITGARQVGKSTLLTKILPESLATNIAVHNFDDPDLRITLQNDPISKLSANKADLVIFDEVQKMPSIMDSIKYLIDNHMIRHCFITGSSQLLLMKNIQESLAGRIALWPMYPLAFSELLTDRAEIFLDKIIATKTLSQPPYSPNAIKNQKTILETHKRWGGYPAVHNIKNDELKFRWLDNYKKTYIEKDIRELTPGANLELITKFLNISALRSGQLLSISDLARDCQVSVTTAQNYLHLFELTYQIHLLKPYHQNQTKRMIKSPKIYFMDTGLINIITRQYYLTEIPGNIYETWVFTELLKWASLKAIPPELFFYRTAAGFEIDFLIKQIDGSLIPIEVKSNKKLSPKDFSPIKKFLLEFPQQTDIGMIIYPGDEIIEYTSNIWAIPDRLIFL